MGMIGRSRLRRAEIIRDLIASVALATAVVGAGDLLISIFGSPF
jgi:hypothetical protein